MDGQNHSQNRVWFQFLNFALSDIIMSSFKNYFAYRMFNIIPLNFSHVFHRGKVEHLWKCEQHLKKNFVEIHTRIHGRHT